MIDYDMMMQHVSVHPHTTQYERLTAELEAAYDQRKLPNLPSAGPALNDLLVRLRLGR